jgi:membrane protein
MANKQSSFGELRSKAEDLWHERSMRSEREPSRLYKFLHFWVLVGKSFVKNRCPIRASALSYMTLLALIPMLALAMSVTTSLLKDEGEQQIEHFINKFVSGVMPPAVIATNLPPAYDTNAPAAPAETATTPDEPVPQPADSEVITAQKRVASEIYGFVQNIQSGALAGAGILFLVFIAIRLLSNIEGTFNDIWGVTQGRSWPVRVVVYWASLTLGPILIISALGLATGPLLKTTRTVLGETNGGLGYQFMSLVVLWLTFAMLYKAIPNTKVRFDAALIGGIVGGTLWHANNIFGFLYVSRVVTYSKIYGSLALVPVFMIGLYFSWVIVLFGAQVAYAFQNRALYLQERLAESVNQRGREFVALRLMTCIGQRFQRGLKPATIQEMSTELGVPSRLVQQVLQTLLSARLVTEVSGAEPAYAPARPLEAINAHHVLMAMRALQGQELVTREEPVQEEVYGEFSRIQEAEKQTASAITILALVNRAQARLALTPAPSDQDEVKLKPALVPRATEGKHNPEPKAEPAPAPGSSLEQASISTVESSQEADPLAPELPNIPEAPSPEPAPVATHKQPQSATRSAQAPRTQAVTQPAPDEDREFPL